MTVQRSFARKVTIAAGLAAAVTAGTALAVSLSPAPKLVTNTTDGKNQSPTIDRSGKLIAFTSSVDDLGANTFDADGSGNDFRLPLVAPPQPVCLNCANADGNGEIFLWRLKGKGKTIPSNSLTQLTFTTGGGFEANQMPELAQKGQYIAFASDRDHTGGNADGNREIFRITVANGAIEQITTSTGGTSNANRNPSISDDGNVIVFDSTRDYAGVGGCTLADGVSPCGNADGNSEIMLWDAKLGKLFQLTVTTGDGTAANIRPRVSGEGLFVAFETTRDFAAPASGTCTLLDGVSPCANSGPGVANGEIMLWDRKLNAFTQVTNTTTAGCSGAGANERVEVSKRGKFVTFQSICEAQLNPAPGCGSCSGNDEAFVAELKARRISQITISSGGFNRVPRISGGGGWIVMESNRDYKHLNASHAKVLYLIKRSTKAGSGGYTGPGQIVEDAGSPLVQSPKTKLIVVNLVGGFNSTVERFGVSTSGRFFSFDNNKAVGNQEIWMLDRNR